MPAVVWVFAVVAALLVFAIAAATVGREAFRLGHTPPPTIFDFDEAVVVVADALPPDAQGRLTYDDVRELVGAELDHLRRNGLLGLPGEEPGATLDGERDGGNEAGVDGGDGEAGDGEGSGAGDRDDAGDERDVVIADDDSVANALREAEAAGLDVTDDDVFLVIDALHAHLADIGAVGPRAPGPGPT